jgi:hypothetical protein
MTITAKYSGTCTKCHDPIKAGESINWERGVGSSHVTCPEKAAPAPADPNAIKISQGSGYGGREYHPSQVLRHSKYGIITILFASKRYFREDGLSFGVGDDSGYIYSATCRPATEAEAAPLLAAEAQREKITAAEKRLSVIREHIQKTGERPTEEQPEGERLMDLQNIYGGGDWWVLGNGIWYVQNNGADGDNWSANNVRTGGAGAIGWRIPANAALIAEITELAEILKTK